MTVDQNLFAFEQIGKFWSHRSISNAKGSMQNGRENNFDELLNATGSGISSAVPMNVTREKVAAVTRKSELSLLVRRGSILVCVAKKFQF